MTIYVSMMRATTVWIEGTRVCFVPWINRENEAETLEHLKQTDAKIVMGHLELDGFEVTPGLKMEHGMDPSIYKDFKQVFSGHYHHKSSRGNITYLGNPYQMFWNDYKDERGFHLWQPKTNRLTRVKNPYEIFKKVYYNDVDKDMVLDYTQYKDTFVKVVVEEKRDYYQFEKLIDNLYLAGLHDIKVVETLVGEDETEDVDIEVKDTLTLLNEYIDEVEVSVDKTSLKKLMRSLYIESCEMV